LRRKQRTPLLLFLFVSVMGIVGLIVRGFGFAKNVSSFCGDCFFVLRAANPHERFFHNAPATVNHIRRTNENGRWGVGF